MLRNGSPIQGPGQPIQRHIQKCFGPSCIYWVYFLCNSTEFHGMLMECQIINTYNSFLAVIIFYHQSPEISWSLAPRSLPNSFPISPWSAEALLSNFSLASEASNLNPPSKIAFPVTFTSSLNEPDHWRSTRLTLKPQPTKRSASSVDSRETSLSTYHLTKEKRSKLPLSFAYPFSRWTSRSSLWKPYPSVSIKSKTWTMEGHQTYHSLFYQILLQ